ncbi:MAG: hypothetical protein GY765_36765 [bacterium]|nr:hypothetical protein [bacterium]
MVHQDGIFTFNIKLKVEDVELIHDGQVFIFIRANMLSSQGNTLSPKINSGLASVDFEVRGDGRNPHKVIINGDEKNPDQANPNGDYESVLSGPNQGIQLDAGKFQLELSLNIRTHAPVQRDPDGRLHEAHVKNVTAKIELR